MRIARSLALGVRRSSGFIGSQRSNRVTKIISDENVFHRAQPVLMREIAKWLHSATRDLPMSDEQRRPFLEQLLFGVASILDGQRELRVDDAVLVPRIAFAERDNEEVNVIDGTWLLDYAPEAVDLVLSGAPGE